MAKKKRRKNPHRKMNVALHDEDGTLIQREVIYVKHDAHKLELMVDGTEEGTIILNECKHPDITLQDADLDRDASGNIYIVIWCNVCNEDITLAVDRG